jgi:hypothetical protein
MDGSQQQERVARNESLFREVNDRVADMNATFGLRADPFWICECADQDCVVRIEMTLDEYQQLREKPTHFAVAPGETHVAPQAERIVERGERYWVVEKTGKAAAVAEELADTDSSALSLDTRKGDE